MNEEMNNKQVQTVSTKASNGKKSPLSLAIIIIAVLLIGVGLFLVFNSKSSNSNNGGNDKPKETDADKFVGIYKATNDKLYIRKTGDNEIHYVIGGNFEGTAKVDGKTAKSDNKFSDDGTYFEFKLSSETINLDYHSSDDVTVAVDLGKYKKINEYTKDNVYIEAVGNPSYLTSNYSGYFKSGNIGLYLYQISEKEVKVESDPEGDTLFSETFVITEDNKLVAKSFFDENVNAFEITFTDKSFKLKVNQDVFGFDEDDKKFELTYTLIKAVSQNDIMDKFYNNY